jgi:hypothetical protein
VGMGLGIPVPGGGGISFASLGVFATGLGTVERSPEPLTSIAFPDPWPPVGTGPGGMLDDGLPSWGGDGGEESAGWWISPVGLGGGTAVPGGGGKEEGSPGW